MRWPSSAALVDDRAAGRFGLVRFLGFHRDRGLHGLAFAVHLFLCLDGRVAIEVGVGEQASGGTGVVEDVEEQLAVVVPHAGAAPDDLFELDHGVDHAHQDDVLAGGRVHSGGEHLRSGQDDGSLAFQILEVAEVAAADVALVRRDPANVIRVLLDQVGVEIHQRLAHVGRVLLVHAEDDGFGEPVGLAQELRQVLRDALGAGAEGDTFFEIVGVVLLIRDVAPVAVEFALARPPARRVPLGDDAVDAVGSEEAVVDSLPQAVGVDRIAEIAVRVGVVLVLRSGRHSDLVRRLKIVQNLAPTAFVPRAAAVAFIHDDQVEEIRRVLAVEAGPVFVLGDGLVDGEVHLPALLAMPFSIFQRASPNGVNVLSLGSSIRMLRSARYRMRGRRYSFRVAIPAR